MVQPPNGDLAALAEDPDAFVTPPTGSDRRSLDGCCLTIGPVRRWAGVCRLRLRDAAAVPGVVGEVENLTDGIASVLWNVGASATPPELPRLLREAGLVDPPPPFEPVVAALVLDREPPVDSRVEVRVVASLKDHIAGLEIMLASSDWPPAAAADERARAAETFAARCERGSVQWLARIGGAPVAWAAAEPTAAGLYLSGAATLPGARGRGCYRALIHARWHAAVDLGLPGLAVQSQYGSSYPILRSLGFVEVAQIHTLHSAARGEGSERDMGDT